MFFPAAQKSGKTRTSESPSVNLTPFRPFFKPAARHRRQIVHTSDNLSHHLRQIVMKYSSSAPGTPCCSGSTRGSKSALMI
jgi:hypothetical protein